MMKMVNFGNEDENGEIAAAKISSKWNIENAQI